MITLDVVQGSSEWFAARVGVPSASCFDKILTTKGEPSKSKEKYRNQLAAERITGIKDETYQSADMLKGIEREDEAAKFYELTQGVEVKKVGLCYPDERKLCCASPDRLVGNDGLLEIKCPLNYTHVAYLLDEKIIRIEYFQQAQGQLFVTGRKWVDLLTYYPGLRPQIIRMTPDKNFQHALAVEIEVLAKEIADIVERIK